MDYWQECIGSSFDEHGIHATDEQIAAVAGDVQVSHENYGMAFGHEAIPNPRDADIARLKQRIQELERELDAAVLNFKKNVARRRNCSVHNVAIGDNGDAEILL